MFNKQKVVIFKNFLGFIGQEMRFLRFFCVVFLSLSVSALWGQTTPDNQQDECTIGVASGKATSDGHPMVWKSRDYSSSPNNEIKYNTSFRYKFISISNAGSSTYAWMGLNEHGFAIVNALSSDLPKGSSGPSNGAFMRDVLGNCKTVSAFRHYLDSTNRTGRETRANFGVIDSTGEAAIFETSGNQYWEFNADDSPNGYVIRTNFSMTGGGSTGIERYHRSQALLASFYAGDSLNVKSILRYQMRDFSDFNSNPVSVPYKHQWAPGIPYGYINTLKSICRNSTVSAAVIHGVLPAELAGLSTFWAILGQPATSIAVPYWPVTTPPSEADGENIAPLSDVSHQIRSQLFDFPGGDEYINSFKLLNGKGGGLWTCTFPFEDSVLSSTFQFMDSLQALDVLPVDFMKKKEGKLAALVLAKLKHCRLSLLSGIGENQAPQAISVYPNPLKTGTLHIYYSISKSEYVKIDLYSVDGQKVKQIVNKAQKRGSYFYQIPAGNFHSPGIYFLVIRQGARTETVKVLLETEKND